MELIINDNTERKRFETEYERKIAFINYIRAKNAVYLTHTEVPKSLEGKGIGSNLVKQVLQKISQEGDKVAPLCPFVASYIREHQEWKSLVADGYNV